MQFFIMIILSLSLLFSSIGKYIPRVEEEIVLPSPTPIKYEIELDPYIQTDDVNELKSLVNRYSFKMSNSTMKEFAAASLRYVHYKDDLKKAQFKEYPIATEVWYYLKEELKYNNAICAGIIGNMVAESGGGTMNLHWNAGGQKFYGLCQWSTRYYPEVNGMNVSEQLEHLKNDIGYQIDTYGYKYQKGFKYKEFLKINDVDAAALAFAMAYERGAPEYNQIRVKYARRVYNYYCGDMG